MTQDEHYMQRALALAQQALTHARPNPAVGCVVVRDGGVVGEGYTQPPGQAHAEIVALQAAGTSAKGATVYVSLEPCAHHGRTGPCADALVNAGVARVVYALTDPNPQVDGKGLAKLRAGGVVVDGPLLAAEATALNAGFIKRMTNGLPYVRCKVGMSLDGRTALANGNSQWITGAEARQDVQLLRARSCAVLTGIGTVLQDDPSLTVRLPDYADQQPLRIVVDTHGRMPRTAKLLQQAGKVLVACSEAAVQQLTQNLAGRDIQADCSVVAFALNSGKVDLTLLLKHLAAQWQCNELLVEAGATLTGALLQAGLIDELVTYIAPSLLGDTALPLAFLPVIAELTERHPLEFIEVALVGEDCKIRSRILTAH
jgi:diaminohydroxyphosphoribosylaminopyrimidine deaminase / 5-amino-6-(5-phosphoribosylamino)uracil reductase